VRRKLPSGAAHGGSRLARFDAGGAGHVHFRIW
jgi:hypothetical protein